MQNIIIVPKHRFGLKLSDKEKDNLEQTCENKPKEGYSLIRFYSNEYFEDYKIKYLNPDALRHYLKMYYQGRQIFWLQK